MVYFTGLHPNLLAIMSESVNQTVLSSQMSSSEANKDGLIETAPTLTIPAVNDATTVEIDRYGTLANPNRGSSKRQTCDPQSPVTVQSPDFSKAHYDTRSATVFGNSNAGVQIGQNQGTLSLQFHHHAPNHSVFDNLALRVDRFVGQQPARIKDLKTRHSTARLVSHFCAPRVLSG